MLFLVGHSVAMVTYSVTKTIPTCSTMIGQFFDTMIVVSILIKSGYNDTSKSKSLNVLETVLSHLNLRMMDPCQTLNIPKFNLTLP